MQIAVRIMEQDDIQQVQKVAKLSWSATYEGIIPADVQERFLTGAYSDEMMLRRMEHSLMLVAEKNEQIFGFANFSFVTDSGVSELAAIYLHPDHQGSGAGTALLQAGISRLKSAEKIHITVERENVKGKSFYDAKGFKTIKEFEEDFDGHTLQSIRMVLSV